MKALLRFSDEPRDFGMGETPEPELQADRVKVKIAYCGICGSDIHIYLGFESGLPQGVHGHEFSGVIEAVGEHVSGWKVGDRVTVEHTYSTCGHCVYCKTGRYHLCPERHSIGFDKQGAYTEHIVVDPQYLHKLPDNVSLQDAALTEPLACILHGLDKVAPAPGERVLVIGPGPMGILAGLSLMAYGCKVDIVGAEVDKERLDIAASCGMRVLERAGSMEYDLTVECSGSNGGIRAAIDSLKKGGTILQVAIATKEITVPYDQMVYKELSIEGTFCHTWKDWEQALRLQGAGRLDVKPVISAVIPLENWKEGYDAMLEKKGLKYLLELAGEDA